MAGGVTARQRSRRAREAAQARHFRRRIRAAWEAASDADRSAGRAWYARAESAAADMAAAAPAGIGPWRAAAVLAALSPRTQWVQNVTGARLACEAAGRMAADPLFSEPDDIAAAVTAAAAPYALGESVRKAARILTGEHPAAVLGGPKVRAFFANITGDHDAVTIDVWAARVAFGGYAPVPAGRLYDRLADAYRAVAAEVGESPRDVQAATWIAIRGAAA